jgi:hypothetical protein
MKGVVILQGDIRVPEAVQNYIRKKRWWRYALKKN